MKRILLAIAVLTILCGCSEKENSEKEKTGWVRCTLSYDVEMKGPEGTMYVYDITNNKVSDFKSYHLIDIEPYILDVNRERVFPFYSRKIIPSKDSTTGVFKNKSIGVFFSDDLPSELSNKENKKLLIVITLSSRPFYITYKVVELNNEPIELEKIFTYKENVDVKDRHIEW